MASVAAPGPASSAAGAMLFEQDDEWTVSRARYVSLEKLVSLSDDPQAEPQRIAPRRRSLRVGGHASMGIAGAEQ